MSSVSLILKKRDPNLYYIFCVLAIKILQEADP